MLHHMQFAPFDTVVQEVCALFEALRSGAAKRSSPTAAVDLASWLVGGRGPARAVAMGDSEQGCNDEVC